MQGMEELRIGQKKMGRAKQNELEVSWYCFYTKLNVSFFYIIGLPSFFTLDLSLACFDHVGMTFLLMVCGNKYLLVWF